MMKVSTAGFTFGSSLTFNADMYDNALLSTRVRNYYQQSNEVTAINKAAQIPVKVYKNRLK